MARRDAIVAATMALLGALAAWQAAGLPFGGVRSPGPGFFPWWASVLVVALALLWLGQALIARARAAATAAAPSETSRDRGWLKVVVLTAVLGVYVIALESLGYPACTFLLVLFMLRVLEPHRWPLALGMAAGTALASYVVFAVWLGVPLPPGPFPR